ALLGLGQAARELLLASRKPLFMLSLEGGDQLFLGAKKLLPIGALSLQLAAEHDLLRAVLLHFAAHVLQVTLQLTDAESELDTLGGQASDLFGELAVLFLELPILLEDLQIGP